MRCVKEVFSFLRSLKLILFKFQEDPNEWRIVFFISGAVYLVCNALFVIFGQASIQTWNEAATDRSNSTATLNRSNSALASTSSAWTLDSQDAKKSKD